MGRRMEGLRDDQKQAVDDEEEEVKEQEGSEEQEVGENSGSETCAQALHGRMPQLEGGEDGEAVEEGGTPNLRGAEHDRETCVQQLCLSYRVEQYLDSPLKYTH